MGQESLPQGPMSPSAPARDRLRDALPGRLGLRPRESYMIPLQDRQGVLTVTERSSHHQQGAWLLTEDSSVKERTAVFYTYCELKHKSAIYVFKKKTEQSNQNV